LGFLGRDCIAVAARQTCTTQKRPRMKKTCTETMTMMTTLRGLIQITPGQGHPLDHRVCPRQETIE
jgi:hypothetical protein